MEARKGLRLVSLPTMLSLFVLIFVALAVARWLLWSYGTDTGIFSQAIGATSKGFLDGPEVGSHLRFHWSPILALLAPLLILSHSPLTIQCAQVGLIAATAWPLYHLVGRYAGEKAARLAALATLLYAPLASIAFEEFHELAFFPVLSLALVETADRKAWGLFGITALGAMLVREDALLVTGTLGIILMLLGFGRVKATLGAQLINDRKAALAGFLVLLFSGLTMVVYFFVIIPYVGAWRPSHFYVYPFAAGPLALVESLVKHPAYLATFLTTGRATYVLEALAPLLFLSLGSIWMMVALPGFLVILLADSGLVWRMGGHYAALWIPWVLLAAADTLVRLSQREPNNVSRWSTRGIFAALCLVLIAFNPAHPLHYLQAIPERESALKALALVPHDAHVLLHDEWYSHVALEYPNATVYPDTPYDWAVLDERFPNQFVQEVTLPQVARQRKTGLFRVVARFGDVTVSERVK